MKKVAVLQSNYIPWKGYFDIINDVDLFIFYDDVQFTKNDWRNRNKIKTPTGTHWLTLPVGQQINRLICEVPLANNRWGRKHWKNLEQYYSKANFFNMYKEILRPIFIDMNWESLSDFNQYLIQYISQEFLGIKTTFCDSRKYVLSGKNSTRLLELLKQVNAGVYVTGPSAKSYIDEVAFAREKISIQYKDYSGYPAYAQLHGTFIHEVSILDLLFNVGSAAPEYIWNWRNLKAKDLIYMKVLK